MSRDPRMIRSAYVSRNIPHVLEPIRRTSWGPLLWKTMHSFGRVLKGVTDAELRQKLTNETASLFDLLIRSIPCPSCRNHATHYKMHHKLKDAKDFADAFEEWAYSFHNSVNVRIQHVMIGRDDANRLYISVDPLQTLDAYFHSINAHVRHGVNLDEIRRRASEIMDQITGTSTTNTDTSNA